MRLLVAGDVAGNFKQFFSRIEAVLKKSGPFEMLFCVGSFFSGSDSCKQQWREYVEGREKVPIATYILGPQSPEQTHFYESLTTDGGELCSNITCLGQRGVLTTPAGLLVAYLSGREDRGRDCSREDESKMSPFIPLDAISSMETIVKSKSNFRGVDLLLTSDWPKGVTKYAPPPTEVAVKLVGSELIAKVALVARPQYHFAGSMHYFYERIPYRNSRVLPGQPSHVTRFIGVAQVGNRDKKNKYLYAFTITPLLSMDPKELIQQPPVATDCPYTDMIPSKVLTSQEGDDEVERKQQFFFDQKSLDSAERKRKQQEKLMRRGQKRERQGAILSDTKKLALFPAPPETPPTQPRPLPVPRGPCWFCLGSPQVEKHLVITVGNHSYLALPKGGLVAEHVLILPVGHHPASTDTPQEVLQEMKRFREALKKYFKSRDQSCVSFERNFKSQHLQIQVIPVPRTPSDALRQAFVEHGTQLGLQFEEVERDREISELAPSGAPYFVAEFDEGPLLFARIRGRFPLQFGREVLASSLILSLPERVDWKSCSVGKSEESKMATDMRQHFQPFDFTDDL